MKFVLLELQVTVAALSYVAAKNPDLKCLRATGCKDLSQPEQGSDSDRSFPCTNLYFELGKSCHLEDIAVGWGFSYFSFDALRPALAMLRSITVVLGGSLGQDGLKLLAATCPLLESVTLYFQVLFTIKYNVSSNFL